jgi:hypothetical protein
MEFCLIKQRGTFSFNDHVSITKRLFFYSVIDEIHALFIVVITEVCYDVVNLMIMANAYVIP